MGQGLETRVLLNELFALIGAGANEARRLFPQVLGEVIPYDLSQQIGQVVQTSRMVAASKHGTPPASASIAHITKLIALHHPGAATMREYTRVATLLFWALYWIKYKELPPEGQQALW